MLLKDWLKEKGVSNRALAKKLGKTDGYVSALCNMNSPMQCSVEVAVRIEELTGGLVTARDLMKEVGA